MARTRSSTSPKGGCERVRRGIKGQEEETHAPAGRGDADDEFNYFHLQSVSKCAGRGGMRIQLQRDERGMR